MIIQSLATGSKGNCYILENSNNQRLIIDAGVHINEIKKGINWNLRSVAGAIISHCHIDHSLSADNLHKMGIGVYKPYECEVRHLTFGDYSIQAFTLPHNNAENYGFYIKVDGLKILYLTDYEYCPYNFSKLKPDYILCECNYVKELMDLSIPNIEHKLRGHCELQTCKEFISNNVTDSLKMVILLHFGRGSDIQYIVDNIRSVIPDNVVVDVAGTNKQWEV